MGNAAMTGPRHTWRPLLSRKASCCGSRPKKFRNICSASYNKCAVVLIVGFHKYCSTLLSRHYHIKSYQRCSQHARQSTLKKLSCNVTICINVIRTYDGPARLQDVVAIIFTDFRVHNTFLLETRFEHISAEDFTPLKEAASMKRVTLGPDEQYK